MPKKDVSDAILGMLSSAGSTTRPVSTPREEPAPVKAPVAEAAVTSPVPANLEIEAPTRQRSSSPTSADVPASGPSAPRTLRLRPATAQDLRDAWLEAKRDDVLLTAQDFASDLVEEMLKVRRRRTRAAS